MQPEDQPTVKRLGGKAQAAGDSSQALDAAELRQLALECGADDAGLVEISRPGLDPQRDELLRYFPWTKTLVMQAVRRSVPGRRYRTRRLIQLLVLSHPQLS